MAGIKRELNLDPRHIAKHLPNTPQMQKLLQKEGVAHVFNDQATMIRVAQAITSKRGSLQASFVTTNVMDFTFLNRLVKDISADGNQIPLYYGEIKLSGERYHVIPRTRPSQ